MSVIVDNSSIALPKSQATLHCADKALLYPIDMTLGKRIKAARKRLQPEMTQAQLGERFGISDKAVSQWERDEAIPSNDRMPELAKALKVTVKWLWDGIGPMPDETDLAVQIEGLTPAEQRAVAAFIDSLTHRRQRRA